MFQVSYEIGDRFATVSVSDEETALALAATFEAAGRQGVVIEDPVTQDAFSPKAFSQLFT